MPTINDNYQVPFNGEVSTAEFYSNPINLTNSPSASKQMAFFIDMDIDVSGVAAITLQFNPNPFNESIFDWQDIAESNLLIRNCTTCADLPQTNAEIDSGKIRGGIITDVGSYLLLFRFDPMPYQYRLRFQVNNKIAGAINKISFSQGN
jgi:hypothetical protein